jgi:hypothetical protein
MLAALLAMTLAAAAVPASSGADSDSTLPLRFVPGASLAAPEGAMALSEPAGVAVDAMGQVWASDAAGQRLVHWSAEGRWLGETGALGDGANQFRNPGAVARLGSLGVAVLDIENRRVVAYDLRARLTDLAIALDAPELDSPLGRITPAGLASDRGGALYVLDRERDRVLAFDFSGRFLRVLGGVGAGPGSFHGLAALATAPRGELVTLERPSPPARKARRAAADTLARGTPARIQWLDTGGAPLSAWTLDLASGRDLSIAVDDSGRVAVASASGRAGEVRLYARDGGLLARTSDVAAPRALAFAPDGTLLVAEAGAARVRRFTIRRPAGE